MGNIFRFQKNNAMTWQRAYKKIRRYEWVIDKFGTIPWLRKDMCLKRYKLMMQYEEGRKMFADGMKVISIDYMRGRRAARNETKTQ